MRKIFKKILLIPVFFFFILTYGSAQDRIFLTDNFHEIEHSKLYKDNDYLKAFLSYQTSQLGITGEENKEQKDTCPPLNFGRVTLEAVAGIIVGVVGGKIGASLEKDKNLKYSWFFVAQSIGSSAGVYIIGNMGNETGNYFITLGGSIAGEFIMIKWAMTLDRSNDYSVLLFTNLYPLFSPIGAIIGFNLTRRYKTLPKYDTGLINYINCQFSITIPKVYYQPIHLDAKNLTQKIDLIVVKFSL